MELLRLKRVSLSIECGASMDTMRSLGGFTAL